ncbi:MAG: hypothetical protein ABW200_06460 [Hyphomicrobiaceae bacterium]
MQSATVSLREFLPVRVAGVWLDPDEVCEFGGTGLVGPVDPLALDWPLPNRPSVVAAVPLPCVPDVDASGIAVDVPSRVVAVPPGVVSVPPGVVD